MKAYTLGISANSLSGSPGEGLLTFAASTGSITIPDRMLPFLFLFTREYIKMMLFTVLAHIGF